MRRLRLTRSPTLVGILGVGGRGSVVARSQVALSLSPRAGGPSMTVSALVLPWLTAYAGGVKVGPDVWPHIRGLELADPDYSSADPVDLLLGAEAFAVILRQGLCRGGRNEPVAQKTVLGWILSGSTGETVPNHLAHTHQCLVEDDLASAVRRFWEQEEISASSRAFTKAEMDCEEHFVRTHSRSPGGRYTVRLPLVSPLPDLSGTRRAAARALRALEGRFERDAPFHAQYVDFMHQYMDLGHMTRVPPAESSAGIQVCYLPHHGVMRETSSTTKLRVVFNGSTAVSTGETLNQFLQVGPNLLPALADVLLRWRRHRFVIATDIEKMFRQIDIHPGDRNLQRIMLSDGRKGGILEYQLNTVTYGLACAPFLAIRTLRQLADDEAEETPLGAAVLRRDVYMDDILTGANTIREAKEIRSQLVRICRAGGFPLKKWSANDASLLEDLPAADRLQEEPRWWLPGESHLTLGLRWHPLDDCFSYSTELIRTEKYTKRTVLSLAARLFDPLGWLAPVTVRAKILFQSTWLLGIDWDLPLPDDDVQRWREFQGELPLLKEVRVPRWLGIAEGCSMEVHGFADASERAYAAAAYLRTRDRNGRIEVRLVAAKTKVAPLKQVTLPRLELCAATLLSRLVVHVRGILGTARMLLYLWSDSTVVLGWIRGHPAAWKTYVANRVSEIQTSVPDALWRHIPGRDNPADCASRGVSPGNLVSHTLWWRGPPWLKSDSEPWTTSWDGYVEGDLPDQRIRVHAAVACPGAAVEVPLLTECSSLQRLLRISAWCRRWLLRSRRRQQHAAAPIDSAAPLVLQAGELDEARMGWVRVVQAADFGGELVAIRRGGPLPARSRLLGLSPFLDAQGILRVGGRLRHSLLNHDAKHPAILPGPSRFTRLIESYHRRTLHGGAQLTLGAIRQEFWIPRGRALVKACILRCLTCLRWRAVSPQPLMGDLPPARVTPARPFQHAGVDYAGPVWLRASRGRGHKASKAFIVVFVCLSSKAVHLDVASDYTADAFLAALRRFVARRGLCSSLYSDCGTNFVGADAQLRALFSASSREGRCIAERLAEERIRWHFNPPAAPNFGGIWEAAVKSMKHHLRRVIGDATLTYEEMATLLCQVEACLNSRPLQAMSDDPEDFAALTPGHFLVGSALNAVPEPSLTDEKLTRLSRWQLLQQQRDHFWNRWSKEYLHTLAHRPKWYRAAEEVRVGRLCLLRNESTPPTKWPLARIEKLHPGEDGQVRVVRVRTAASGFTRPVSKLVLLPIRAAGEDDA